MPRGEYRHLVTFEAPGDRVPDGEGGYTQSWVPLDLEYTTAGTAAASATHIVRGDYRADVTTTARMVHEGRPFQITGIANLEERDETLELVCEELLT
jgi:head-tail adaptor